MSKYSFGRKFEYEVKKSLETLGFFVIRSSGSHGAIDILGCKDEIVFAIQVKASSNKKHSKGQLKKDFEPLIKAQLPSNFHKLLIHFYLDGSRKKYLFQIYNEKLSEL